MYEFEYVESLCVCSMGERELYGRGDFDEDVDGNLGYG
jgi:hypothetical protein